ncbi:hypothetical protein BpHYR1_027425 [Brachionus plicatilis]|uniref:Uncharacterized protein n=1 Tax=Brachionus plicatilis TaxID=10195 RepID=A0A3M7SS33_BRAPC|nr:hypothetical protein BpHYR1_027425 [Brachionus plicatilis]
MHDIFGYPAHFSILTTASKQQPSRPSVQACLRLRLVQPTRPSKPAYTADLADPSGQPSRPIRPNRPTDRTGLGRPDRWRYVFIRTAININIFLNQQIKSI